MDLSNDLISQFVKITNDDKKKSGESTVYGTVVEYNGGMYVKIDGSDLLTPVETTADFKPDERVTVMIKNHSATVTGNISSPAANEGTVTEKVTEKVTEAVEDVEGKVITEVEILIADRVSTEQLDAEVARIDTLIAGKATIEDLEAIDAKIENLEVENLEAINAEIENLKANKAEIGDLKATNATIENLDAEFADIKTLVNGNLTSDNILSFNLTADKVTVDDAFIKDAMIDNVSANKINAGTINTNNVNIQSEDGSLIINGSTQQFKDDNGNVRIQIGKDATGDFTFALYGKDGKGQLINQNGITASAIGDGLIVNDMVSDNAAISGGKLDISSVITEINNDNSTTLKSSKVYLDDRKQTLEVAFNNLTTKVDTIKDEDLTKLTEQVTSNATQIEVNEGKIESLVLEDSVIKEQITDLNGDIAEVNTTLTNKYSKMEQDLNGFKTSVNDTYATKKSVTDLDTKLTTNYSTTSATNSAINQKANEITSSVSQTYATKSETAAVQDQIDATNNNLATNYSTTTQMNSAINQKANAITSSVSQTYATKQSVTDVSNNLANNYSTTTSMNSIIQQTASDLTLKFSESGGYNLIQNGHANKGTSYWTNNGGGLSVYSGAGGNATGNFFNTSLPSGIRYSDWIQLLPNTHYVYQAKVWSNKTFTGHRYVPLHYWFSYDCDNTTSDGYTMLDYQQSVPVSGTWTQCYLHFVTGDSNIYFKPFIYNNEVSASQFYVTEIMLSQSRVVVPWSPHPSEIYSGITQIDKDGIKVQHSNANSYTHMAPDGFFVNNNGTDVVQVTASGLYVQGNITSGSTIQGARITGSTFNSSNDVFQVLEDGTIETSFLAVNGAVSTDKLNVNDIENASYPKALSEATTVYIYPNGGVNSEEFYDGAYFTSLSSMLSVAPRNLNGYTLTIRMMGDLYENAALTWFHSGQVNFEMQGYTLYGYFYGYGASMCYRLYGNTNGNNNGTWGHIKPNVGRAMGSYYYAVQFQYCQFAVNYVAVYPSASSGSSSGGIGVHRGATGIVFNAKACGDMRYLVRAEYAGRVHVNSTQGACNNATFCALTGGIITLNSSNNQAGRSTTGNPYWVGSGGLILCDQRLGMDKITFNNTSQSGSSSSSGSTTRKVTETIKASSADTYRSTVYNNWKGDGTVRQGDYGYGDCQGCWFFGNNLYTTMNAGTVTKVVIRIQRQSGGVNALQTLTVKSHNHTSRPSGAPTYTGTIGTCSCAIGSYIDLVITDSTTINKLKNCKGLGLSIGSASSPYAVCSGACSVIITYTTNS